MRLFTVIGKKHVWRVRAKSIQALNNALRAARIPFQAIHEDGRD